MVQPLSLTPEELQLTDIYDITLGTGARLYLTPYGGTYTKLPRIDGNEYQTIPITRTKVSYHTDLQVDTVDVSFGIHAFTVGGRTIVEAIQLGWFDDAEVIIRIINLNMTAERREIFRGQVGKGIKFDRKTVKLSVTSTLDLLKAIVPKIIYQEQCNHKLWSSYCGLSKVAHRRTGTAATGSTRTRIISAIFAFTAHPSGHFVLGEIRLISGANAGVSRTIRFHNNGNVDVYQPFDFDVAVGDSFEVFPGCDKSGTTCATKFGNYANFLGFEYIPRPEIMFS